MSVLENCRKWLPRILVILALLYIGKDLLQDLLIVSVVMRSGDIHTAFGVVLLWVANPLYLVILIAAFNVLLPPAWRNLFLRGKHIYIAVLSLAAAYYIAGFLFGVFVDLPTFSETLKVASLKLKFRLFENTAIICAETAVMNFGILTENGLLSIPNAPVNLYPSVLPIAVACYFLLLGCKYAYVRRGLYVLAAIGATAILTIKLGIYASDNIAQKTLVDFTARAQANFSLHIEKTAEVPIKYAGGQAWPVSTIWSPDGSTLAVASWSDKFVTVLDRSGKILFQNSASYPEHVGSTSSLAFIKGATQLILPHQPTYKRGDKALLDIRDTKTGDIVQTVPIPKVNEICWPTCELAVSNDQKLAAVGINTYILIYDTTNWHNIATIVRWFKRDQPQDPTGPKYTNLESPYFLADNSRIAFLAGNMAYRYDARTGRIERNYLFLQDKDHVASSLLLSPTYNLLAFVLNSKYLDAKTHEVQVRHADFKRIATYYGANSLGEVRQIAWDPKERYIAILYARDLCIWQFGVNGVKKIALPQQLQSLERKGQSLAVNSDGSAVAVAYGGSSYPQNGGGVAIYTIQ